MSEERKALYKLRMMVAPYCEKELSILEKLVEKYELDHQCAEIIKDFGVEKCVEYLEEKDENSK